MGVFVNLTEGGYSSQHQSFTGDSHSDRWGNGGGKIAFKTFIYNT